MAIFISLLGLIISGVAIYLKTRSSDELAKIDLPEVVIGGLLCLLSVMLIDSGVEALARSSAIGGYKEFWNGSIVAAESSSTTCNKDGACVHTYTCDRYTVLVTKTRTVPDGIDSKGKPKFRTETYQVPEVRYHKCPYATAEYSYWLEDSFGDQHMIAQHIFAAKPTEWRPGEGLPKGVPRGEPALWAENQQQIAAGNLPPATKVNEYDNFILAADQETLKRFSADIRAFKKDNLLPPHTSNWQSDPLNGGWMAQKFQAVGGVKADNAAWNHSLGQFNSALGNLRQGDLHLVAVPSAKVQNPQAYLNALTAYWQGPDFGKWAFAKNGIVVVLGISADGQTVEWVRAATGMPIGNGTMLSALSGIKNIKFTPQIVLGSNRATWNGDDLKFSISESRLSRIIIGDKATQFKRPCMKCEDKGDNGNSYVYLEGDVVISGSWGILTFLLSLLLGGGIWYGLLTYPFGSSLMSQLITRGKSSHNNWRNP